MTWSTPPSVPSASWRPPSRWTTTASAPAPPTAPFASETRPLLAELGFDDSAIDDLIADGAVRSS